MTQSIHGHDIMHMIHDSDPPLTPDQLAQAVKDRYGENVEFHACAGGGMTLDQLLEFLTKRGKIRLIDGTLRTDIGLMCGHGD